MRKVYIFNNWHNGDIITNRCLIKALLYHHLELSVGSYKNRHYLVGDLPVNHIIAPWDEDTPRSPCLSQLCPPDHVPVNSWCGTFHDIDKQHYHNWSNIVLSWNRFSEMYGLGVFLSDKEVPMIDFEYPCHIRVEGRGVFVENGPTRSGHSHFYFDINKLATRFPELKFFCTDNPCCNLPNVVDCSNRNLVDLSFISNGCEAIIGKGSGPFLCTLTEVNRKKPKAVVQYNSHPFWLYRDNPLRNLKDESELLGFLERVNSNPLIVV